MCVCFGKIIGIQREDIIFVNDCHLRKNALTGKYWRGYIVDNTRKDLTNANDEGRL